MRGVNRTRIDGRYTIERPLGSGGMAEVFLAHDGVLERDVAARRRQGVRGGGPVAEDPVLVLGRRQRRLELDLEDRRGLNPGPTSPPVNGVPSGAEG